MNLKDYSFYLDDNLIARYPSLNRDESRLMVVNRKEKSIQIEPFFKNILSYLQLDDILIYNSTRVSKRRIFLYSSQGREHETMFLESTDQKKWKTLVKSARKLKDGDFLHSENKQYTFQFFREGDFIFLESKISVTEEIFEEIGTIPIPPYLKRKATKEDEERYQTVFADKTGSVAAPTAGLHFTKELISEIQKRNITMKEVFLEVGYGTFAPLEEKQIQEKKLHLEKYSIPQATSDLLNNQKGRVIAIGTTSLRALESSLDENGKFRYGEFQTDIFIQPGDMIRSIQGLITNFHLPESSLLLLVCAFGGKELILNAYKKAIQEKMRFYSYGDAMLII